MRKLYATILAVGLFVLLALPALATAPPVITVDGAEYTSYQQSGPVDHYETPGASPASAFTLRHVWNGINGAELLPCEFGIHWVDNNNLLTISHCLPGETTTTTTSPTTTTTNPTTTTTSPTTTTTSTTLPVTTTTLGTTTTTDPTTTTTLGTTTTTDPTTTTTAIITTTTVPTTLPRTGAGDLVPWAFGGMILLALGGATVWLTKEN